MTPNTDPVRALAELAERAVPFLRDEAAKYDDDGSNEPLELAREIETALASLPSDESALPSANSAFDGGREAALGPAREPDGYTSYGEFRWACDCDDRMKREWTPVYLAPPSAPVGVEDVVMAARNAEDTIRNCAAAGQIGDGYVQYADDLRDAVQRLAQQRAAPSGEAVAWLRMTPDGTPDWAEDCIGSDDKFLDPEMASDGYYLQPLYAAPQQPASVDEALIAGAMEAAADACSRHVVCNEAIAAAVEYALSQQQGGRADG